MDEGHSCERCGYLLDEEASIVFNNLEDLESSLSQDVKMALVYIAGYVCRKEKQRDELTGDTTFYLERYGGYINQLNRGGLSLS